MYLTEGVGNAADVPVIRETVVTAGLRTISDEGADTEVAAGRDDAKRYEKGFGNMVNGAV
jgi:hypothetical protein